MAMNKARANVRLPPEVNRVLYVRNLPYKITAEEMYDIFGKYGAIRQIRSGISFGESRHGKFYIAVQLWLHIFLSLSPYLGYAFEFSFLF